MRRRVVLALIASVTIACGFVACGLDEHGEATDGGSADATSNDSPIVNDAPIDVPIDVPQACKTLDATACVDAAVPDGWTFAVITQGDQLCPTTIDYDKSTYLTNLAPQSLCACTCAVSGTVDCSGLVEAGTQPGCNGSKSLVFDAGNDAACINVNWGDPHYAVATPPTSTAKVSCDASAPAPGWTASTETSCTPKCTADYCNVGSTYKRCIVSNQNLLCPAPFTVAQPVFGIEAGVTTSCTGCGCTVTSAKCGATIQPFNSNSCDNAVDDASAANGTCNTTPGSGGSAQVNSIMYTPIVPAAGCSAAGGTPSAQFGSTITVCCLP